MRFSSTAAVVRWGSGLFLGSLAGCIDPYLPNVTSNATNYLVVDGFINGDGITRIKLSRTENVATTAAPPVETKATVYIVDDQGTRYTVRESTAGFYKSDSLALSSTRQYRLRITTAGASGTTYESALVPLKVTPPIDKLSWQFRGEDVELLISTHDPAAQARYFRWGMLETWEFNSAYVSELEYINGIIQKRVTPIYTCWRTERPTAIRQASTIQLGQSVLTDQFLASFSGHAERVKIRYSVLVSQYAETAEEFAYNELLRKNTEAVGGVNDPLPSQLTGNVHRLDNAQEPVLGFVAAHTVQTKRLFISQRDLNVAGSWVFNTPYKNCFKLDSAEILAPFDPTGVRLPHTLVFNDPNNIPLSYLIKGTDTVGYRGVSRECADCRVRGTTTKPSFW